MDTRLLRFLLMGVLAFFTFLPGVFAQGTFIIRCGALLDGVKPTGNDHYRSRK